MAVNRSQLQFIISAKDEASKQFNNLRKNLNETVGTALKMSAIFGAGIGLFSVVKGAIQAAAAFEQTQVAFNTMLGSAAQANTMLRELSEFAAKTPFQLTEVEQGAKALLAFGIEGDKIIPTLKSLGDVSAGLAVPMERLILNFGQVKAQAKLTGREMRDFAIAGVPLLDELAKNLNKSKVEIQDMVSEGKIGFKEVEDAFESMSGEGGRFFDLMDKQSKTFLGRVSNLRDNWELFLREQGNQLIVWAGVFVDKLAEMVEWLRKDAQGLNYVGKTVYGLGKFFVAFGKTLIAVNKTGVAMIATLIDVGKLGVGVAKSLRDAFKASGSKITQIVTAIAMAMTGNFKGAVTAMKQTVNDSFNGIQANFENFKTNAGANVKFVTEAWAEASTAWSEFATLEGFDSVVKEYGELGTSIEKNINQTLADGSKESKKMAETFTKLNEKIKSTVVSGVDELSKIGNKIKDINKSIEDLKMENVQENLSLNQELAEAFVEQEQKVLDAEEAVEDKRKELSNERLNRVTSDTLAEHNNKLAQIRGEIDALKEVAEKEREAFESRKTIAMAFEDEVNEAKRRARLTDFERTVEDINKKRLLTNQEFQKKIDLLNSELKAEKDKFDIIKELQKSAVVETDKFLATQEKLTVDSINREIEKYNELAKAIARARSGQLSGFVGLSPGLQERIGQTAPAVNINIEGNNFNGTGGAEEFLNESLMPVLKANLKVG